MSQPREGSRVAYIGRPDSGPQMGAEGQLLAITGSGGHVRWASGELTYAELDDLVSVASRTEHFEGPSANNFRYATTEQELAYSLEFTAGHSADDEDDLLRDSLGGFE